MLLDMTKSEIHAVMTGGYARIAGGVMAAFVLFGVSLPVLYLYLCWNFISNSNEVHYFVPYCL